MGFVSLNFYLCLYMRVLQICFIYLYFLKNEKKKRELIDKLTDILEITCKQ